MNDNNFFTNSKIQYVDQEQLKILAGTIRKYINDLNNIKTNADAIWEQSSTYLEDNALKGINTVKSDNNKKYSKSIEELNEYANKIDTVANIWEDTENEIKSSSKKLESFFDDIGKTMRSAIDSAKNNNNN